MLPEGGNILLGVHGFSIFLLRFDKRKQTLFSGDVFRTFPYYSQTINEKNPKQ